MTAAAATPTTAAVPEPARTTYAILSVAVLCVSFGSIFVRWAAAPPLVVAFYRIGLAALLLAPFAGPAAARTWPTLAPTAALALLGAGLALAAHFATWISSLAYTSIAASVLLVNTTPIFNIGFSRLFLGETVSRRVLGATALALVGAGIIAGGDWSAGPEPLKGDLLALAGAVALSLYHVAGRGLRATLPLDAYVLAVWSTAAMALALLALAFGQPLTGWPARSFGFFLALAVVPTLGGHGLVNRSLRRLPAPIVGLFLLGEPVGASILGYLAFGEVPGIWTLVGGAVVLAALVLVALESAR